MWLSSIYTYIPSFWSLPPIPSFPTLQVRLSRSSEHWVPCVLYLTHGNVCIREGNGTPLQYSCLENPKDGGAWQAAVYGVAKSQTRLSNFTFTFHFHALEKEMATHSSVLAWRNPGMGSHRVGHDWSDLAVAMYIYFCYALNSTHPLLLPVCQVHSLCLCLYSYPANRFISTIFLDSIHMH